MAKPRSSSSEPVPEKGTKPVNVTVGRSVHYIDADNANEKEKAALVVRVLDAKSGTVNLVVFGHDGRQRFLSGVLYSDKPGHGRWTWPVRAAASDVAPPPAGKPSDDEPS